MASLTGYSFISLPLLRPVSSQRHSKIEIKLINDTTIASMCSSEKKKKSHIFSSVQFSSVAQSCLILCDSMNRSTPGLPVHWSLTNTQSPPKPMSIESVMPSNHLILCCSLLLLPSIFPSIRVFSSESVLHIRWPKYWSFSFNISPSNEHPGLISFRMD